MPCCKYIFRPACCCHTFRRSACISLFQQHYLDRYWWRIKLWLRNLKYISSEGIITMGSLWIFFVIHYAEIYYIEPSVSFAVQNIFRHMFYSTRTKKITFNIKIAFHFFFYFNFFLWKWKFVIGVAQDNYLLVGRLRSNFRLVEQ